MKNRIAPLFVFALLVALTPALALLAPGADKAGQETPAAQAQTPQLSAPGQRTVLVYDESSEQVLTLEEEEYVLGAVLCEMPALYEPEALKAQAVACRSYARYVAALREREPLPELRGASFSVNTATLTGYMSEEKARSYFGDDFSQYYNKVRDAVGAVAGRVLTSGGEPVCACYHAISPGRTEDSGNVFAASLPYLVPADSAVDTAADGYLSTAAFTASELAGILAAAADDFTAAGAPSDWLGAAVHSESGTVLSLEICARPFTGTQLRALLGLRSAAFDAAYDGETGGFVFTVRGYGHGVGMSQFGANELAKRGMTFEEILAHYYSGAALS